MQSTHELIDELRAAGFDLTPAYVSYLIRERILAEPERIGRTLVWTDADAARLKSVLRRRGRGPDENTRPTPAAEDRDGRIENGGRDHD